MGVKKEVESLKQKQYKYINFFFIINDFILFNQTCLAFFKYLYLCFAFYDRPAANHTSFAENFPRPQEFELILCSYM